MPRCAAPHHAALAWVAFAFVFATHRRMLAWTPRRVLAMPTRPHPVLGEAFGMKKRNLGMNEIKSNP
jgi:hypothetical protein